MPRIDIKVALGLGVSGALVEVTSYVNLQASVERSWGRESEWEDTAPGTFAFTLDNADGRFTPEATALAVAAGYTSALTQGTAVCVTRNDVPVAGTVVAVEPAFPDAESAWAEVRVSCDDMLGSAARLTVEADLSNAPIRAASPYLWWPFDDDSSSGTAAEDISGLAPLTDGGSGGLTFGSNGSGIPAPRVLTFVTTGGLASSGVFGPFTYGSGTVGAWGFWAQGSMSVSVNYANSGAQFTVTVGIDSTVTISTNPVGTSATGSIAPLGPHWITVTSVTTFSGGFWQFAFTLAVDGVTIGTATPAGFVTANPLPDSLRTPNRVSVSLPSNTSGSIAHLVHGLTLPNLYYLYNLTESSLLTSMAASVPEITLDTIPALSSAPLGTFDLEDMSALDVINSVVKAEQGWVYSATTGTLTSPTQKVKIRRRDRVAAVTYSFNAETEADGTTDFVYDLTNAATSVEVVGPDRTVTVTKSALSTRFRSKNVSEDSILREGVDLTGWGGDYLQRGANTRPKASVLRIDAMTTGTNRSSDLLAMVPGDRIRITGLPSAVLGSSTWDGWLLGVDETHSLSEHTFELHLQPCLPDAGVYNTSTFDNAIYGF